MANLDRLATQQRILDAAGELFAEVGYAHTSMNDIANRCGMTAANLYRFFPSKLDIAEASAWRFHREQDLVFLAIQQRPEPPLQKLYAYFYHGMRACHTLIETSPKVLDLVEYLVRERPHFSDQRKAEERVMLCEIIAEGQRDGTIRPGDADQYARSLQAMVVCFRYPPFLIGRPLSEIEGQLQAVLGLCFNGLSPGATLWHPQPVSFEPTRPSCQPT